MAWQYEMMWAGGVGLPRLLAVLQGRYPVRVDWAGLLTRPPGIRQFGHASSRDPAR